jgi:cardiolipin synthase
VLVADPEIHDLRAAILTAFDESRRIDLAHYEARPRIERILNWLAYNTYRAVMKVLTVGSYD